MVVRKWLGIGCKKCFLSHQQGYAISFLHNIRYYLRFNEAPFKDGEGGDYGGDQGGVKI